MKKHRLTLSLLLLTCLLPFGLSAQETESPETYRMDYVDNSYFRIGHDTLHFVKATFEWPAWVEGRRPPVLITHISNKLFGVDGVSMDDALGKYLNLLGNPSSVVPDDTSLVRIYHSLELKLIDYSPAKYMSFRIKTASRNSKTMEVNDDFHHIFTFDLTKDKILKPKDILKTACFPYKTNHRQFVLKVLEYAPYFNTDIYYKNYSMSLPGEVCLLNNGLVSDLGYASMTGLEHALGFLPSNVAGHYYTKNTLKLLSSEAVPNIVMETASEAGNVLDPDTTTVYKKVNEKPKFLEENGSLGDYFSKNLVYPDLEKILGLSGRVLVTFVVERDGSISNPAIVSPVSSGFDRESIRVVKMMPKWKPGCINGIPVRTKVTLPVNWQLE